MARQPLLCLITDRRRLCAAAGRPLEAGVDLIVVQAEAAAAAAVDIFQIREPDLEGAALLDLARRVRAVGAGAMQVAVNDRADVALAAATGLHLRGDSIPAFRLRSWLPARTWISAAVHASAEARAMRGVDLIIAGTVQPSRSKDGRAPLLGFDGLASVVRASAAPVLGVGGLSDTDWPAVRAAGAAGIAAIDFFLPRRGESPGRAVERAAEAWRAVTGRRD